MTVAEIYQTISTQKPPIIYLSGKTSTGKSTFARRLRDELGYKIIELEAVLLSMVKEQHLDEQSTFRTVMHGTEESPEKTNYLQITSALINEALKNNEPVVIEGAIANVETLQRVLQPATPLLFLYFHPDDMTTYVRNLTNRFMEADENSYGGLSMNFWKGIDADEFKTFCKTRKLTPVLEAAIRDYALNSQKSSTSRLEESRRLFGDIMVVDIER